MNDGLLAFLALTLTAQLVGVGALIWTIWRRQTDWTKSGAAEIFAAGEVGHPEAPAARGGISGPLVDDELIARSEADRSSAPAVLAFVKSAVFWLVFGSIAGLLASLQMTFPDWITKWAPLTFGRLRPIHLNTVIYGWTSMVGVGISLWLLPRLLKTPLRGATYARRGAWLWNFGMVLGVGSLFLGKTDGLEWLEYPWMVDLIFVAAGAVVAIPLFLTLAKRRCKHLYVSVLYITGAFVWFPLLFFIANIPGIHFGVEHGIANWWFAHNVLGLWLTPLGLAAAYYLIPKVLGRPVYSYGLSMLGFWSLALFYSQVGVHHLIGGPVPTWVVNLSIVTSVMMILPVVSVAINHHLTVWKEGGLSKLKTSPTLRFVVLGAMLYTVTSFEGSMQAVRAVNQVTHFTHATVAHAHLGVYGFVTMVMFGALYFAMPRLLGREWPKPALIGWHFWLAALGIGVYFVGLTIGGVLQGYEMLDASTPFSDIVKHSLPYLHSRSIGGGMMVTAHLIFATHVWLMLRGTKKGGAA